MKIESDDAGEKTLWVQSASGQTETIVDVQDSSGNSKFIIDASFNIDTTNLRITPLGGLAAKCVAGEDLYQGELVVSTQGAVPALSVTKCPTSGNSQDMPVGTVYEDALSGASVWVTIAGIGYVKPIASVTIAKGNVTYSSGTTAGRVDQATGIGTAQHWRECGHPLEDGAGNGLVARAIIHFN